MTIDEAIAHAREVARVNRLRVKHPAIHRNDKDEIEACILCAEEHEQLAEWLEDYKRIKMLIPIEQALKAEYNKAIDDFVKMLYEELLYEDGLTEIDVDYIAEQLKAGASDGNG